MKKILILLFASTLFFGCKKKEIKKDLIGEWHYVEGSSNYGLSPFKVGFIFHEKEKLNNLRVSTDGTFYIDKEGVWSLVDVNTLLLDFGNVMYPSSGNHDFYIDDEEYLYINDFKYERVSGSL